MQNIVLLNDYPLEFLVDIDYTIVSYNCFRIGKDVSLYNYLLPVTILVYTCLVICGDKHKVVCVCCCCSAS